MTNEAAHSAQPWHIDVHDMAVDADGRVVFVNTMFGCLATFSDRANFEPLWRPPFLSALVPEDRCHLNGLAMRDGRPAFVTVVSRSDVADSWRDKRHDGGCELYDSVFLPGVRQPMAVGFKTREIERLILIDDT